MIYIINNKEQILIIDDDEAVRDLLSQLLAENYSCTTAKSAEEALSLIQRETFDLVISDINMRGISGLEMITQIIKSAPDTVAMMISGEQTIDSAIEAMRAGAFDYIKKPFDIEHVEAAVRRALEHHSLLRSKRLYEDHLEELVKQRTDEVNYLSYHDPLTDLPNRILFEDRLNQALALAGHNRQILAILFFSLDRFKKIHDTLGHTLGNELLQKVAERLIKCVGEGATVARFEGDEFAAMLTRIESVEDIIEIINDINEAMKLPFDIKGHELFITASIGVSLFPDDGNSQTLIKNAGTALYRVKEQGGNNYQFYTADMNTKALKRLEMENDLRRALEREEFEVYYQPKLDINTNELVGAEALLRWRHPEFGLVSPAEFIPLAEEIGLIIPIGEWVLRNACAQNKSWQDEKFPAFSVAVNLSVQQLQQPNLSEIVTGIIEETKLNPSYLELELTESSIMKNAESAVITLFELKQIGVKISIDDFGTGYSSLSYLKRLPLDVLKIDQSFVRDLTIDPDDAALVMAIVTLAHNLRLRVVAEGVETAEQLKFLHLLRCDEWQGYLCSKPVPATTFREFLLKTKENQKRAFL